MAHKSGRGPAVEHPRDEKIRAVQQKKQDLCHTVVFPGPQYNIPGDFDFPDPRNPEEASMPGKKKAKFAFGMRLNKRATNLDMPGAGEYETDTVPMSMKNPAYWIGTDVRKDLGVPNAFMFPGPGHYYPEDT